MGFLTNYTNQEYEEIPENKKHRLYPYGGIMPIMYWGYPSGETTNFSRGQKPSDIDRLVANGFTAYGVDFGNDQSDARKVAAGYAGQAGLRHVCSAYGGSNTPNFQTFCTSGQFDNGPNEQGVIDRVGREVTAYIAESRWNDYIDMWFVCPEETGQRMDIQAVSCGRTAAGRFLKNVRLKVNSVDSQKRPVVNTDLTGTSTAQYNFINKYRESYSVQTYKANVFLEGLESPHSGYPCAVTQRNAFLIKNAVDGQTYDPTVATLEKPFAFPLLGPYYRFYYASATVANYEQYAGYMTITHMAQDAKGFQFYRWDLCQNEGHSAASTTELVTARSGILSFVKLFTDNNFQNACLWGYNKKGRADGVGVSWTGPQNADFYSPAESLTYFDKQLGETRYLGFTNSHWSDTCGVTMTGLPVNAYIKDIKTGNTTQITSSTKTFNVRREDWAAFTISDTPPGPPSTPTAPTLSANNVDPGDSVTLSSSTTGATSVQWQRKRSGGSWSNI